MVIVMIKWILQDLKRILKSHKTYILLIIILLSMINFIATNYNKEPELISTISFSGDNEAVENTYDASLKDIVYLEYSFDPQCIMPMFENDALNECKDYKIFKTYIEQLASDQSDEEHYRLRLFLLDKMTDKFLDFYDSQVPELQAKYDTYLLDMDFIKDLKVHIKESIAVDYEDFEIPYFYMDTQLFNMQAINLHETYENYTNNYPQDVKYQMTSSFFIANYLNDYFLLLVVAGILLIFDSYYRDYKLGVTKNILSAPMKRFRYIIVKTISAVISLLIIIFIPLLLCSLVLYIMNGYDTPNYPIYVSKTTLSSFNPERSYIRAILPGYEYGQSTYRGICSVEPVTKFAIDKNPELVLYPIQCLGAIPGSTVRVLPLSNYIFITLGYLILLSLFIASLNTTVSLLASNQVVNVIILLSLVFGSNLILNSFFGQVFLKLLPFTFMSPTALMMQTIPYTMLNGIVTVSVWTIIVTAINYYLIEKKDFTY